MSIVKDPNGKRKSDDSDSLKKLPPLRQARMVALKSYIEQSRGSLEFDDIKVSELKDRGWNYRAIETALNDLANHNLVTLIPDCGYIGVEIVSHE